MNDEPKIELQPYQRDIIERFMALPEGARFMCLPRCHGRMATGRKSGRNNGA